MAPKKTTGKPTTIGQRLIAGKAEITDTEVLAAVAAKKAKLGDSLREGETITVGTPAKKTPPKKRAPRKTTKPVAPDEPWDQQPEESTPAWEAFRTYRDMGATRSTAKVARRLGKSKTLMDRWSGANSWQIRVSAYDKFLDREWQKEVKERRRRAARRNADMSAKAMDLVHSQMDVLIARLDPEDDRYMPEAALDVLDMRRLVDSLGKLERLALDESTENVQVTGKDGGPVRVDYTKLTDEERIERLKHLRDEAVKRLDAAGANGDDA